MSEVFKFIFSIFKFAVYPAIAGNLTTATQAMIFRAANAKQDQISLSKLNRALMGSHQKCLSAKCRR